MDGKIKKIKDMYPVTVLDAVKVGDGTSKSLKDMIDNGEIGSSTTTTATTSGRGYCQIDLRGDSIFIQQVEESLMPSNVKKIAYKFPTGDSDRMRRMYVWTPSGGNKNIEIPDGELELNNALIYNFDTNTLETRTGTWGNVRIGNNEIILLYLDFQCNIGGILAPYIIRYKQDFILNRELDFEICSDKGAIGGQGMFIIDDKMYLWGHSSDDRVTTQGSFTVVSLNDLNTILYSGVHDLGHMNAPSYNHTKDMMIAQQFILSATPTKAETVYAVLKNIMTIIYKNRAELFPLLTVQMH
jgi:hypothetical protein